MKNRTLKYGLLLLSMSYILFFSFGCSQKGTESQKELHITADAKSDIYYSAKDMSSAAEVIVKVKKMDDMENILKGDMRGGVFYGYTLSDVQVERIYKNNSGMQILEGDTLQVFENQFSYEDENGTIVTCHVNNYNMMEVENEDILYMNYSESDGWYTIVTGLLGKINLDDGESNLFPAEKITYFESQPVNEKDSTEKIMETLRRETLDLYH